MLVARPATTADFDDLVALANKAGPGFTSLAVGEGALRRRLEKSEKSFSGKTDISPNHVYLLMLEDSKAGKVCGMSAIKAQIGLRDPFFNFRILKIAQRSKVTHSRFDMEVLILVNEYAGATEVGSLYVTPDMRGTGAGRLISQARYMLMAADPDRFANRVISELRGHVDETGYSPFWEAIGRKFFQMDFNEADHISAEQDNQFILDLMPKYPIYAALLPDEAQAVMGQTHPAGEGARRYLEGEGFRYNGVIDIFDGGPSVSAPRDDIRTVKDSRRVKVSKVEDDVGEITAMVSNDTIGGFRCVLGSIRFEGEDVVIGQGIASAIDVKAHDTVRIWVKR